MRNARPIIFSVPMVRAILDGRKSQTRRIVTPQPDQVLAGEPYWHVGGYRAYQYRGVTDPQHMGRHNPVRCPYGGPGDHLWVRELVTAANDRMVYTADGRPVMRDGLCWPSKGEKRTISPIHLPRWASRLTLEIINLRVERVQEITPADAKAEGVPLADWRTRQAGSSAYVSHFRQIWTILHGTDTPRSWEANPWVWVIAFRLCTE